MSCGKKGRGSKKMRLLWRKSDKRWGKKYSYESPSCLKTAKIRWWLDCKFSLESHHFVLPAVSVICRTKQLLLWRLEWPFGLWKQILSQFWKPKKIKSQICKDAMRASFAAWKYIDNNKGAIVQPRFTPVLDSEHTSSSPIFTFTSKSEWNLIRICALGNSEAQRPRAQPIPRQPLFLNSIWAFWRNSKLF